MIIESITEGFNLTNKNWQIIVIKVGTSIINIIGFFIFVVIPIALAFVSLGIDLNEAREILPDILRNPQDFFSKYLGLVVVVFIALSIYLTMVSVLILYIYSGMLGVLRDAVINSRYKFSLALFFEKAKSFFFPLLWLFSIALLAITIILIILAVLAVITSPILQGLLQGGNTISVFITSFLSLMFLFLITILILGSVIITSYSAASLIVRKSKVIESIKDAWYFVNKNPKAYMLYIILIFIMIAVNFLIRGVGTIFMGFSTAGILFTIPYLLIASVIQNYFSVVMWGSLLVFYIKGTNYSVYTTGDITYDI